MRGREGGEEGEGRDEEGEGRDEEGEGRDGGRSVWGVYCSPSQGCSLPSVQGYTNVYLVI